MTKLLLNYFITTTEPMLLTMFGCSLPFAFSIMCKICMTILLLLGKTLPWCAYSVCSLDETYEKEQFALLNSAFPS